MIFAAATIDRQDTIVRDAIIRDQIVPDEPVVIRHSSCEGSGMDIGEIRERVRQSVSEFGGIPIETVDGGTQLVGQSRCLKSRTLVEVLLDLEDFAEKSLGVTFDWTSDAALSPSRSPFRSVDSLAQHLFKLQG